MAIKKFRKPCGISAIGDKKIPQAVRNFGYLFREKPQSSFSIPICKYFSDGIFTSH
ncbi:hypothetical protein NMO_1395 [Neisseria meningitidis alpha14]|uniref:Uncharacterized protein n=1 Tax=Neisseria meningitidis (strain alpha14) TaxID=662598 RepID=C6S830_NEIML|nr:hypothetical protein NMO_1395 [Neisseria meningitidis alpha14]